MGIYVSMYYVCKYLYMYVGGYVGMYICELKHCCFVVSLPWYFTASNVTKCHHFKENVKLIRKM